MAMFVNVKSYVHLINCHQTIRKVVFSTISEKIVPCTFSANQFLSSKHSKEHDLINDFFIKHPDLNKIEYKVYDDFIISLTRYGFEVSDCFNILIKEPKVLKISSNSLTSIVSQWNKSSLGNDYMKLLLLNRPEFFFLPPVTVARRLSSLSDFVPKPKKLIVLLLQCPNVLTEKWQYVEEKIDYLLNVMRVEKGDILRSCALNKTLQHIQLRYTLLLKCGLYVPPHKWEHKRVKNDGSAFKNPPLKRIVDNEDISFARKICKISHEEYETYKAIFEQSLESRAKERYSESDSDSDLD